MWIQSVSLIVYFVNLAIATEQCSNDYFKQIGDIPGWGQVGSVGYGRTVGSCRECALLCTGQSGCNSYECSPTELKCNLNAASNPSAVAYKDYIFCTKDECPNGYFPQSGDVPGWGQVGGVGYGRVVTSCQECAGLCSGQSGCYSYECSPTENKCNLNEESNPSAAPYKDYMFCSIDQCSNGYFAQSGDIPGWGQVGGVGYGRVVSSCQECADLCSAQSGCESYECSPTERKCNLNGGADPSAVPYKDYMFCTAQCPSRYFKQSGDIPGWGQVGGVGSGRTVGSCRECALLCTGQSGCNSYECSPTELKCNLNVGANPSAVPYKDYIFCSKDECSNGYFAQSGDIPGWGQVGGVGSGRTVSSCHECASLCSQQSGCNSYECSPTDRKCNLNGGADPSAVPYKDYMFCTKGGSAAKTGPIFNFDYRDSGVELTFNNGGYWLFVILAILVAINVVCGCINYRNGNNKHKGYKTVSFDTDVSV